VGKSALGRGLPLEHYAFPTIGIPEYRAVGPEVEPAIVYAIARQESIFDQRTVSNAKAMGLMQVTAEAGRYVAKKFNVAFDNKRLLSDPIYNVQMGAAELGDLIVDYRGPTSWRLPATMPGGAREGLGCTLLAIRAILSIRSTGSSASCSRRRAITCSA
jgi:soluble lytic murein transglycosylase-like protein